MIRVYMLGRFEITANGNSAAQVLANSKKGRLMLEYLILHKDEPISAKHLYAALWPDDTSSNPEGALKTMVSRLRASLTEVDDELGRCIATRHGSYTWNSDLPCVIDVFEFEALCGELAHVSQMTPELGEKFDHALTLYAGDIVAGDERDENWLVSRSAHYHSLYLRTAYLAARLMKAEKDYDGVIRVCRRVLDTDMFDETLHLELMDALTCANRTTEALMQCRHATNLHYKYLGTRPPEKIQQFYKRLIQTEQSLLANVEEIRENLQDTDQAAGAYICDYVIFRDIYHLMMRNLSRLGNGIYLGAVMLSFVGEPSVDPLVLDGAMRTLLAAMAKTLRRGDIIARYSASQFAVLLPSVNAETGRMVMERIRTAFYSKQLDPSLTLSYKLEQVEE